MTTAALQTNPFSIITTSHRSSDIPVWKRLFDWPSVGDTHLDYAAETPAQRNLWATRLDEAVRHADKPVLLIASGESCHAAAWWARLSPADYVSKVAGALLFTPPDASDELLARSGLAAPAIKLPFPSAIVEPSAQSTIQTLAARWGSEFLDHHEHLHSANRRWQNAQAALLRLTARVVDHDLRLADTLGLPR